MQFGTGLTQYIVGVAKMHLHSSCILQGPALNMVSTDLAGCRRPGLALVASYPALG
jgi:hypothetical protein